MPDEETVIRHPHEAIVERKAGKKTVQYVDPRTSVEINQQQQGACVTLFFDPENAFTGEAKLLEVRLTPPEFGRFEPWRLMPRLATYTQHARAQLAADGGNDAIAAIRALRQGMSSGQGLTDQFLQLVANAYASLLADGEPHPVKTLADTQPVDVSTASRWVKAARERGFLQETE